MRWSQFVCGYRAFQLGKQQLYLPIANQGIPADERQMQRLFTVNDGKDVPDQLVAFEI
jgi:hypothetical protein